MAATSSVKALQEWESYSGRLKFPQAFLTSTPPTYSLVRSFIPTQDTYLATTTFEFRKAELFDSKERIIWLPFIVGIIAMIATVLTASHFVSKDNVSFGSKIPLLILLGGGTFSAAVIGCAVYGYSKNHKRNKVIDLHDKFQKAQQHYQELRHKITAEKNDNLVAVREKIKKIDLILDILRNFESFRKNHQDEKNRLEKLLGKAQAHDLVDLELETRVQVIKQELHRFLAGKDKSHFKLIQKIYELQILFREFSLEHTDSHVRQKHAIHSLILSGLHYLQKKSDIFDLINELNNAKEKYQKMLPHDFMRQRKEIGHEEEYFRNYYSREHNIVLANGNSPSFSIEIQNASKGMKQANLMIPEARYRYYEYLVSLTSAEHDIMKAELNYRKYLLDIGHEETNDFTILAIEKKCLAIHQKLEKHKLLMNSAKKIVQHVTEAEDAHLEFLKARLSLKTAPQAYLASLQAEMRLLTHEIHFMVQVIDQHRFNHVLCDTKNLEDKKRIFSAYQVLSELLESIITLHGKIVGKEKELGSANLTKESFLKECQELFQAKLEFAQIMIQLRKAQVNVIALRLELLNETRLDLAKASLDVLTANNHLRQLHDIQRASFERMVKLCDSAEHPSAREDLRDFVLGLEY